MARYQPSERINQLWNRAQGQPDDMFLPMFRDYCYLEGWMSARNEPLPIRNAAGLCNVIENMPLLMSPGEIIVGESGDHQCDNMINFFPSPPDYRDRVMSSALTDVQTMVVPRLRRTPDLILQAKNVVRLV